MRSMVEGAQAVKKILRRQEKLRRKRPPTAHSASKTRVNALMARSPLPAFAGRDVSAFLVIRATTRP
jgi:hypothetical protein